MPKKRRNNGRNKKNRGNTTWKNCDNCHKHVPKDKMIKKYQTKSLVEGSSKNDIKAAQVYENFKIPNVFYKKVYCVSCACHARIVKVRSAIDRRIRFKEKKNFKKKDTPEKEEEEK